MNFHFARFQGIVFAAVAVICIITYMEFGDVEYVVKDDVEYVVKEDVEYVVKDDVPYGDSRNHIQDLEAIENTQFLMTTSINPGMSL